MGKDLVNKRISEFLVGFKSLGEVTDPRVYGRDPGNPYHDLLYWVSSELKPKLTVELGTCTGGSTSYLAAGTSGTVLSIDIETRPSAIQGLAKFDNIELINGDTRDPILAGEIAKRGSIDLLFIDTDHTGEQVSAEMALYGPLVRQGGIILFDDIRMHPCISDWWDKLEEEKLEMPELHWTSFGVVFR